MKLLMCMDCLDIFNLTSKEKTCGCGKTKGRYTDELNAEYTGDAQAIGFANHSFNDAYHKQKHEDNLFGTRIYERKGVEFSAFFIPSSAKTVKQMKSDEPNVPECDATKLN